MLRLATRVRAWLVLIAAVLLGGAPAHGMLFCLGVDGSVELEMEVGGRCGECCGERNRTDPGPTVRHRCGCVDVQITLSGSRLGVETVALPAIDRVANTLPRFAIPEPSARCHAEPIVGSARPPPLLVSLHTIVILI